MSTSTSAPNSVGNIAPRVRLGRLSPFITARARIRCSRDACASRSAARNERIWPGSRRSTTEVRATSGAASWNSRPPYRPHHGRSAQRDERDLRQGWTASRSPGADRRSGPPRRRRARWRRRERPRAPSSPRVSSTASVVPRPPRVDQVLDVLPLVVDLLAQLARAARLSIASRAAALIFVAGGGVGDPGAKVVNGTPGSLTRGCRPPPDPCLEAGASPAIARSARARSEMSERLPAAPSQAPE